jgi:hypothetical protein
VHCPNETNTLYETEIDVTSFLDWGVINKEIRNSTTVKTIEEFHTSLQHRSTAIGVSPTLNVILTLCLIRLHTIIHCCQIKLYLTPRRKLMQVHHIVILTFNIASNHTIKNIHNKTKLRTVSTFLV